MTKDELRAAAAHIQQQQWSAGKFGIGGRPLKGPFRLARARNDFGPQTRRPLNGLGQVQGIHGVARGAGGNHPDANRVFFPGNFTKLPHGFRGARDAFRLQPPRFVETLAQPGLPALFEHRSHFASRHVRNEQLDRIRAHINDRAAYKVHQFKPVPYEN